MIYIAKNKLSKLIKYFVGFYYFKKLDVYLPITTKVIGSNQIKIGKQFGAGKNFWIEAVTRYFDDTFDPNITIGDNVSFSDQCHVASINEVSIGNGVLIGSGVHITDHSHGNYSCTSFASDPDIPPIFRRLSSVGKVRIEDNVWIGDGVVVLPGVTIGRGSVIGANSVVSRSIPEFTVAVGAPAKAIKQYIDGEWRRLS